MEIVQYCTRYAQFTHFFIYTHDGHFDVIWWEWDKLHFSSSRKIVESQDHVKSNNNICNVSQCNNNISKVIIIYLTYHGVIQLIR